MNATSIEKELLALERQYWQAIKDRDAETAAVLSDDPCLVTGAQGVGRIDRKSLAGMVTAAPYRLRAFQLTDPVVCSLTDDVAVLAYRVHEELIVDDKPVTVDAADSSTWVRRDGRWVCAAHTEAISGDPYGRDRRK